MSFLIIGRERYALQIGESTLGGSDDEVLALSDLAKLPPSAVITAGVDGTATIRTVAGGLPVSVGGRRVGMHAVALRHGDRLEIGGTRILYGDLEAADRTSNVAGLTDEELSILDGLASPEPTAATGGRLLFPDGTAYDVPEAGIDIGRDPQCGVVLRSKQVSRRHATIAPGLLGYTITDASSNGLYVNGVRVNGSRLLARQDVIRAGDVEFRFDADTAVYAPERAPTTDETPAKGRSIVGADPEVAPIILLATLEIIGQGLNAGRRFRIERPTMQLGRGAHNDVQLADESVSSAHATLMQRGRAWQVLDLGSRNGTYVDGERVRERALTSVCELRLGNVKMLFRAIASGAVADVETLGIVGVTDEQAVKPKNAR